jgi:hypothetical protein
VLHPFTADLLLEVDVTNQDNVANGSGNGYNWADFTGIQVARAYCLTNVGCLVMFGSGLIGLAGIARRRFMR